MTEYLVEYKIDVNADNPQQAAIIVAMLLKDSSYEGVYNVTNKETNKTIDVDLEELNIIDNRIQPI